jgi:hypothetical protein
LGKNDLAEEDEDEDEVGVVDGVENLVFQVRCQTKMFHLVKMTVEDV